jgi:hypothetical protein
VQVEAGSTLAVDNVPVLLDSHFMAYFKHAWEVMRTDNNRTFLQ